MRLFIRSRTILAAIALLALMPRVQAQAPTIETESILQAGSARLSVRVFGSEGEFRGQGAELSLNLRPYGYAPLAIQSLAPGTYLLRVGAPGYFSQELSLDFVENTSYKIVFTLERKTGYLSLAVDPQDALVRIDGAASHPGLLSLPTGRHFVEVSRFGYLSQSYPIEIDEGETTGLVASLDLAPFELGPLGSGRPSFDPRNASVFGSSPLSFRVSSWGSGRLMIRNEAGETVASWDFPLFDTWNQRVLWKGRDGGGLALPNGQYTAILEAWPQIPGPVTGTKEGLIRKELALSIDSRLALSPFGNAGAILGLLYLPEASLIAPGTSSLALSIQLGQGSLSGAADLGFQTSYAHSWGNLSLAASLGLGSSRVSGATSSGNASLGLAWALKEAGSPFSASLLGRLAYLGEGGSEAAWTRADLGQGLGLELGLPLAVSLGPIHLGLAPGLRLALDLSGAAGGLSASPLVRAGLWYGNYRLRAGISALAAPASFAAALDPGLPISGAAELHWAPGDLPLALSAALCVDLQAGSEAQPALFLGLDFLF